jgi:hypothetical protein
MILAEDYPALSQLLAAYFHEDWKMDARNYAQLVREFVASEPPSLVGQASIELRGLLARPLSEAELEQALDEVGCYLYPAGTGITVRAWLDEVSVLLEAA